MKNVLISPINAVLYQLDDQTADYILCTSRDDLEIRPRENVLVLRFMDITDGMQRCAFQKEQAEAICRLLQRTESADDLFVCCDAGESRSAAIAAAVLLAEGGSDSPIWNSTEYHPNPYVFKLQCAAFGIGVSDDEILIRKKRNDNVFHRAIKESNRY